MITFGNMKETLLTYADDEKAKVLQGFFKTGKGEYGEGDTFAGIPVPQVRKVARQFREAPLSELTKLLSDPIHECRLLALLTMIEIFKHGDESVKQNVFETYLAHTRYINNWDLVDLSSYQIVGQYLLHKDREPLHRLSRSNYLWEQRISIVATWIYIRSSDFTDTLIIADRLQNHPHDLMQKAVGWMLREVGKKDKKALVDFLERRYMNMPRTMVRYAVEKFSPEERRKYYLKR